MIGAFFFDYIKKGIGKAQYGTRVHAFGIDSGVFDKSVITTEN